uniref:alpha/beta hydrolase family protein n=1 Tax=Chitinimonas sp. TaxID=1934313 RepID=UPI0035AFB24C
MLRYAISLITLFALAPAVQAAGRVDALPPPALGSYPMACSNLAIDDAKLAQSGVSGADLWTGIIRNGQTHYLAEALAEPASAFSAPISPPNDKALYPRFANQTVPLVSLFCYPTTPDNPRPAYRLPDGPSLPHMERSGDAPLFADAAQRYPLIVFSHGMGGSPVDGDTLSLLAALVSKGYAVLAPFHGDQRIGVVQIKDLGDVWKLVRNFDQYVELQAMRPLGIRSALDTLLSRPDYAAHIDAQRIGGFGASLGGEAMMLAMGARLTTTLLLDSRSVTTEPRLKAVVGYIPYSGQSILPAFGLGQDGAAQARGPYLALSGSADIIAPTDMSRKALQKMQGSRYLVELQGVPHGFKASYAADVLGWLLPFYDAYLNDQPEALDRLSRTSSVAGGLDDRLLIDIAAPAPASAGQVDVVEFLNDKSGN